MGAGVRRERALADCARRARSRPDPGRPAPGTVPRGEFEATFGISGTPIPSGFLYDLGEYNPELAGRSALPT